MVMIITEFGCDLEKVIGAEFVGENVDDDVIIINTSAFSSIESEEATESVEESVDGVFSQEDDETLLSNEAEPIEVHHEPLSMKENVDEAESISEGEPLETQATNVTEISMCVEDEFDKTQTNIQPEESVERTEFSHAIKYVKLEHENGDVLLEEFMDQPKVTFPATFVSFETNIQFGSFSCLDETTSELSNPDNPNNPEPVLTYLQESDNSVISEGVDDIDDSQRDIEGVEVYVIVQNNKAELKEEIKNVQLKLDEERCKDVMLDEIHEKWASMIVHKEALNSMNLDLMTARKLIKSKRQQIDHIERVINKVKNAIAVEDIDNRVNKAEQIIKDETLSTEDEEKFIREIKQLKIMRLQLASNIVSPNEIQQKDQVEELLKDLNMELKTLKDAFIKAQVVRNTLSKKYDEERDLERELWARFIAAEDSRKEDSSTHLYSLEKLLNEEVERYMDEWDKDEEFGRHNMLAINSGPTLDEVKSTLEVTDLETQKTVEYVKEEQSGDQINENVLEKIDPITKTDEINELTKEEMEAMLKEKIRLDEEMKENKAQERKQRNALKAQKRAEKRVQQEAQEEAQQQEKRRLRRLKKREKKRASLEKKRALAAGDAANSNVKDEIVAESNKSNEFEKQPTIKIKNQWTRRGNMIITFLVLVLSIFSFLHSTLQQKPIAGPHQKTYIF